VRGRTADNLAEVNPDNTEESLTKGRYAAALMEGIDKALEDNMTAVHKWWDDQDARREARASGITAEMYDRGERPKAPRRR
jgi:hypothetical protein